VCHWLCLCGALQGTGSSIDYLSPAAAVARVLTGVPQILNGGRFFDKDGNRMGSVRCSSRGLDHMAAAGAVAMPVAGSGNDAHHEFNSAGVRLLYNYPADEY